MSCVRNCEGSNTNGKIMASSLSCNNFISLYRQNNSLHAKKWNFCLLNPVAQKTVFSLLYILDFEFFVRSTQVERLLSLREVGVLGKNICLNWRRTWKLKCLLSLSYIQTKTTSGEFRWTLNQVYLLSMNCGTRRIIVTPVQIYSAQDTQCDISRQQVALSLRQVALSKLLLQKVACAYFVAAICCMNSNQFEFMWQITATKFCRSGSDFHMSHEAICCSNLSWRRVAVICRIVCLACNEVNVHY